MQSKITDNLLKLLTDPLSLAIVAASFLLAFAVIFFFVRRALKRKGVLSLYARVLKYVFRYKLALVLVIVFSFGLGVFGAGILVLGEPFVNQVMKGDYDLIWYVVYMAFAMGAGLAICRFVKAFFHQYLLGRVYVDIRTDAADNILEMPLEFFDRRKTGSLLARLTNDVMVTQKSVDFMLGDIIEHPIMLMCLGAVIFLSSWQIGLIVLISMPLIALPLKTFGKKIRRYSKKSLKKQADATHTIYQSFSGIRIVKAFGMEGEEQREFRAENERYFKKFLGVVRNKAISNSFVTLATRAGAALVLALTGIVLKEHLWDVNEGMIVAIAGAAMLMNPPIKGMVKAYNKLQESMAGAARVFELMDVKSTLTDAPNAVDIPPIKNDIVFDNVDFAYDSDYILKNTNLTIKAGEMVAVVGPSGAGKSTLMNLIPRFYDPSDGAVRIDGVDLREVKTKSLLDQVAIVTQDPFLFYASVRDNIRYGRRDATEDEIIAAAQAANAHDFIANELPQGYDTIVGERGARLSGGQKQRITIARAILKDPAILLLDEATSSLDSHAEKLVQEAIDRLTQSRTTIVIAHRLSTVIHADKIVVLEDGRIIGMDKHEALYGSCPQYKKLYNSQFAHTKTQRFTK